MQPYEITILILGLGVLGYVLIIARKDVQKVPNGRVLLASFLIQFFGWIFSTLHRTMVSDVFGAMEDVVGTAATILLGVWCYLLLKSVSGAER